MAGKLTETANIDGGTIQGCNLIDNATVIVEEDTARLPSFYRAKAVTAADEYTESKRIARATISGPGAATAGRLRTRAPVDTAEPVVQKYEADDGTWRRKSTDESTWSGWIRQVDGAATTFAAGGGSETVDEIAVNPVVKNNTPGYYVTEADISSPAGRWGWYVNADQWRLARYTGASWQSVLTFENAAGSYAAFFIGDVELNTNRVYMIDSTQVVGARKTGWTAASGTAKRDGFATSTVTHEELAQVVKALIDDLISHGLVGA